MSGGRAEIRSRHLLLQQGSGPLGAADWLGLAAAPTFAIMAVVAATQGRGATNLLCAAGHAAPPLGGMAAMYLLMGTFHSAAWVRLIAQAMRGPPASRRVQSGE